MTTNAFADMQPTVQALIEHFELAPHPEGGYYREIFRSTTELAHPGAAGAARSAGTFIYYLLPAGEMSAFHRVRASDEIWHVYAGGPLELHTIDTQGRYARRLLTTDLAQGAPASVVPGGCWQATRPVPGAAWAFCGCTVAPGFDFADFEMPEARWLIEAFPEHAAIIRQLTRR